METLVDVVGLALVAKVTLAIVVQEILVEGFGEIGSLLNAGLLQGDVYLSVRTDSSDVALHLVTRMDVLEGHVGFTGPKEILTFVQDFGLILFVFMIGLQVGPGFFESFKKGGVTLNMLSASAILLNILVMFGCYYLFFDTSNPNNLPMMVGTLYGAVTNTPGLGADLD